MVDTVSVESGRRHARYPSTCPISYKSIDSDEWLKSFCEDISVSGMRFRSAVEYGDDQLINIKINSGSVQNPQIFTAKVVWNCYCAGVVDEFYILGVEFQDVTDDHLEDIEFMKSHND